VTLIKKYGNRRLYDTRRSCYVTLEELTEVIAAGDETIKVVDAKTGEDLTKPVMTKIILLEEERRHLNLLPLSFLRKLIQHRAEPIHEFYQRYLTLALDVFVRGQREVESRLDQAQTPQLELSLPPPPPRPVDDAALDAELEALRTRLQDLEARIRLRRTGS
jgi:polyhydroxyalkanoate synthesis repressor PhaR